MRIFIYCLFSGILGEISAELSDKRLCADPGCNDNSVGSEILEAASLLDDKNIEITTPSPVESGQTTGYDVTPSPYDAASHGVTSQPDVADAYSSEGQVFDESASVAGAHAGSDPYATGSDATTIGSDPYATESEHTTTGSDAVVTGNDPYALESNLSESDVIVADSEVNLPNPLISDDLNHPHGGLVGEDVVLSGQYTDNLNQQYTPDNQQYTHGHQQPQYTENQQYDQEQTTENLLYDQQKPYTDNVYQQQNADQLTGQEQYTDQLTEDQMTGDQLTGDQMTAGDHMTHSHDGSPVTGFLVAYLPDWLHEAAHSAGGINGDRAILLIVIAFTLVLVHLIQTCVARSGREKPLIAKLADLDRQLFQSNNELLLLRKEATDRTSTSSDGVPSAQVRELEVQLEQATIERDQLTNQTKEIQSRCSQFEEEMYRAVEAQQEKEKEVAVHLQEKEAAVEEARQAQEMVEEMINSQNNNTKDDKLIELVQKLQKQLESQQDVLKQYEPRLKKKERESRELTKECKQLKADLANAQLARDKALRDVDENRKSLSDSTKQVEDASKNEDEWRSLTDLLQSQLDHKSEQQADLETELASIKSRLSIFQNELEEKDEQCEVLQETVNQLKTNKKKRNASSENGDDNGWEVDNDDNDDNEGWEVEEVGEIEDVANTEEFAKLKVAARRALEGKTKLEEEIKEIADNLTQAKTKLEEREGEVELLRNARDETVKELVETNRRKEVLEQFFNKKEAELQKQLGLQSARFGDVSTNADSTARKLMTVTEELDSTKGGMKALKNELEEQEKSLKAAVALQEKKAHENWVAARQAERKLTDLQTEVGTLRNRLTVTESKAQVLEQEKIDLQATIQDMHAIKPGSVSGMNGTDSSAANSIVDAPLDPASLPPLPGLPMTSSMPATLPPLPMLPGMMVPPLFGGAMPPMMDSRLPPLGRMSPPRDSRDRDMSHRSGSPTRGGRDYSPSTRSERRRRLSPRRPSPTRSDRGYYRESSSDRSLRREDRYGGERREERRSYDYDRHDEDYRRGDYDRRARDQYLKDPPTGPKTSSPMDPGSNRNYV